MVKMWKLCTEIYLGLYIQYQFHYQSFYEIRFC